MARFAARKLIQVFGVLLIVSFALAFVIDLTPGDPAYAILGENASPEQIQMVHDRLNLDAPIHERYWDWVSGIATLDFGASYFTNQKVTSIITARLPATAELVFLSLLLALLIAIPIGILSAYKADTALDRAWLVVSSAVQSVPHFVSALVLVWLFAVKLKDFPVNFPATGWIRVGDDPLRNLWHATLPATTLALYMIPNFSRLLRADMIDTLQDDYILAAKARGVPTRRILFRHALRPSSLSLVTVVGISLAALIGGSVVVETLFALPGLGQILVNSIVSKDLPVVQGIVMFIAIMYVLINTIVDMAYHVLDPRVRVRGG